MSNQRIRVTELDFDTIKNNLINYLQGQSEFTDYDFEGSSLNVLIDLLAYNTHYNAYYLNMVANESFLDTALLRDSVVSHAKTLGYIPKSVTSPKATINLTVNTPNSDPESLTIPKGYIFISNLLDNKAYSFVTIEPKTVTKSNTNFYFENLEIYEGQLVNYVFTHNESINPKRIFTLPDADIDTSTIYVTVSPSSSNTEVKVYNNYEDILDIKSDSEAFFIQEGRGGKYQIYFGDGIVGKKIPDGAVITVTYVVTSGSQANKINGFIGSSAISGYTDFDIDIVEIAAGGSDRESIESVKFSAPAQFANQNRLVTFKDYENYIQSNYPFIDSISVWGGEDETPPVYGKVYISLKPKQDYYLSDLEKQRIVNEIIKPKSIVSVESEIRDPEYLYLKISNLVKYDKNKTTRTEEDLEIGIKNSIIQYRNTNLNRFGSTFVLSKLQDSIDATDLVSIIGSETTLRLEKRFQPTLNQVKSYIINFNTELHRGTATNKLKSTEFQIFDNFGILRRAQIEEVPQSFTGLTSIEIINPGSGYTSKPTVTITGDGTGATAEAKIVNGKIESISVTNRGTNYTRAVVTITGGNGYSAAATAVVDGSFGDLRTVFFNENAERQIINSKVGTIDYLKGIITIDSINFISINSPDGLIRVDCESEKGILSSGKNFLLTIDDLDTTSIVTELEQN